MNKYMHVLKSIIVMVLVLFAYITFHFISNSRFFSEKVGTCLQENKDIVVIQGLRQNNVPFRSLKSQPQGHSGPLKTSTSICVQVGQVCSGSSVSNCCPGSVCHDGKCVCTNSPCQSNSDCCKYNTCHNGTCTGSR